MAKSKGGIFKKIIYLLILVALAGGGFWVYENIFKSNVHLNGKKFTYIYIKSNATMDDVLEELYAQNIISDHLSFEWLAKSMNLQSHINPGKYRIDAKMSNRSIIKSIINAKQEKVKLFFNSQIRTKEQFIDYVAEKLEIEKRELEEYCSNDNILAEQYGLNSENFMALIVPETYELNWTTHIDDFFALIKKSYNEVWTNENTTKAKSLGYAVPEIITLASIVQSESHIKSEQQKIAGVYINRLKQDIKLQADPTIVFANANFDVQRVLSVDKEIDSPYNTYRYKGLPPGPICLVKPSVIDAVLNYTKHNYTYFCANSDFSGYSCFTDDYRVHQKNAKAYQEALNKKGIKR
jgi:UPF0755 protein